MSDLRSTGEQGLPAVDVYPIPSGRFGDDWLRESWERGVKLIESGSQSALVDSLSDVGRQLAWYKRNSSADDWLTVRSLAEGHALYRLLGRDPFVREARNLRHSILNEPALLDFIFGCVRTRKVMALTDDLGRRLAGFSSTTRRSRAIRRLKQQFGEDLMQVVARNPTARIASVGCAHLRELEAVPWYSDAPLSLFIAVDREFGITSRVRRMFLHGKLKAVASQTWEVAHYGIVMDGMLQRDFDLICSISALDAVDDLIAERLIEKLTESLAPGGKMILSNSLPDTPDAAFQETFMGQRPYARSRTDIDFLLRKCRKRRDLKVNVDDQGSDEFIRISVERLKVL